MTLSNPAETISNRIRRIRERIDTAARRSNRLPESVALVAVTKTFPLEAIRLAFLAGQRDFGESRVQEALPKLDGLAAPEARWHLIGHLQSNKVNAVAGRFSLIHSVDSAKLIEALEKRAGALDIVQRILLQLNVSGEASKSGAPPEALPQLIEALAAAPHLVCEGLMTIPPDDEDSERARPHFARLRALLSSMPETGNLHPRHLSMGMSGDFETAVEEGATIVRIGTYLFGSRD